MRWQTSCCCLHDRDDPEHVNMRSGKPAVHFQSRYRSPSPSCVPRRVRPAMRYFHLGQRLPLPAASGPPPPPWSSASVCAIGRHALRAESGFGRADNRSRLPAERKGRPGQGLTCRNDVAHLRCHMLTTVTC